MGKRAQANDGNKPAKRLSTDKAALPSIPADVLRRPHMVKFTEWLHLF